MKAILLAAGRGSRLGPYTADKPKTLIPLHGKTLLQRNLGNLHRAGIEKVVVVVGYRHEMIEEALAKSFPANFYKVILNPDFTRGSASSLICAQDEMEGDVVIVESDLLYDHRILLRLQAPTIANALTMGFFNHGRKEVKIYLNDQYSIANAAWAEPTDDKAAGDWVGFTRLSPTAASTLKNLLRTAHPVQGKELGYEEFVFQLLKKFPFHIVYIQDLPWIEIDNEADLQKAEAEIGPKIDSAW